MVTGTPRMVTDGLVLYIDAANTKSYPGSGTVWTDLSRTQITGSLTNGPTFNTQNGGSIFFDGTDDIVDFGTSDSLNFTDSFSVSFWMRANLSIANKAQFFVNRWTWDVGSFRQWTFDNIIQRIPVSVIGTNSIAFSISSAGTDGTSVIISSSNSAYSNNWVNVCGIWDKSNIYLYINGVSANTPRPATAMVSTPNRKTFIGGTLSANIPITGSIAITSMYNRALSATEVLQNFEATRERFGV
jgi:hypothetical protein